MQLMQMAPCCTKKSPKTTLLLRHKAALPPTMKGTQLPSIYRIPDMLSKTTCQSTISNKLVCLEFCCLTRFPSLAQPMAIVSTSRLLSKPVPLMLPKESKPLSLSPTVSSSLPMLPISLLRFLQSFCTIKRLCPS